MTVVRHMVEKLKTEFEEMSAITLNEIFYMK